MGPRACPLAFNKPAHYLTSSSLQLSVVGVRQKAGRDSQAESMGPETLKISAGIPPVAVVWHNNYSDRLLLTTTDLVTHKNLIRVWKTWLCLFIQWRQYGVDRPG